jgi:hypothetical protein
MQNPTSMFQNIANTAQNEKPNAENSGNTSQNERWKIQCVASSKENREKRKPKKPPKLQSVPETFCKVMQM